MSTTNKARVVPDPQSVLEAQKAEYAKDAAETDRPWERWEMRVADYFVLRTSPSGFNGPEILHRSWQPCTKDSPPQFLYGCEYRRKKTGGKMNENKHIHAHLMVEYAKDAMQTKTPWTLWQWRDPTRFKGLWMDFAIAGSGPGWNEEFEYRRKVCTININGVEVPEPVREPLNPGDTYFVPHMLNDPNIYKEVWRGLVEDYKRLAYGMVHLNSEAAHLHAKALLSFTTSESEGS